MAWLAPYPCPPPTYDPPPLLHTLLCSDFSSARQSLHFKPGACVIVRRLNSFSRVLDSLINYYLGLPKRAPVILFKKYIFRTRFLHTYVSAFREIHQSFQYFFLRQYPMKFQDFFLVCKIYQMVWRQLDYRKLGLWEKRLLRPLCHKTEKSCFHVWYTDLKNMY